MKGYILSYKPKDVNARTLLNHTLYGRLIYKERRGKRIAYYSKGIFDDVFFARIFDSKIFVTEKEFTKVEERLSSLKDIFGEMNFEEAEREEDKLFFKTGKQHWQEIAKERGYYVHAFRDKIE